MPQRLVLLAHGSFSPFGSKTANCVIRYRAADVVAVLDATRVGDTAEGVLGFGGAIPVRASMADCLADEPTELLVGIAPPGGGLPDAWRRDLLDAVDAGVSVSSGLHVFLGDDPELSSRARATGAVLRDLRRPPAVTALPTGQLLGAPFRILATVGTDCNVGKMSAALEMTVEMKRRGIAAAFAATGQTGIFLSGRGIAVDRVVSDFVAGATEELVRDAREAEAADVVVVEGQGSLSHPAYSGVTLSLLHGAMPHAMVLCHHLGRVDHAHYPGFPLPPVEASLAAYERMAALVRPASVVALAANGSGLAPEAFAEQAAVLESRLGVPVCDPYSDVGGGIARLVTAALEGLGPR